MHVLLGVLLVESLVSTGTLAWNVANLIRHRNDFEKAGT